MRAAIACLFLACAACHRVEPLGAPDASACVCPPVPASVPQFTTRRHPDEPTTAAPHVTPLPVCAAKGKLPLEAARDYYDSGRFEEALSCGAQASALAPEDVLSHTERANALSALGRDAEAALAYARALALQPDSTEALLGAAHFYVVAAPSTREHDELGSLYAERGFELAQQDGDDELALQFARLSAMAFNDIGQSSDAVDRADWVLAHRPRDADARYEKAMALFELCRFAEARRLFEALLTDPTHSAHAHHHLGLVLEREGRQADADAHFAKARALAPEDLLAPVLLPTAEFEALVGKAVEALPPDMRRDLEGIPVGTEDLPQLDDLVANEPPLSPTILGLFRGPPLDEPCPPPEGAAARAGQACRSLVLYRRNLARAVKTREELAEQIRVTLLHEVGHLRGEDDYELAARGLE